MQAEAEEKVQVESHEGWTARLPPELVEEWENLVLAWEKAPYPKKESKDLVNPFAVPNECEYLLYPLMICTNIPTSSDRGTGVGGIRGRGCGTNRSGSYQEVQLSNCTGLDCHGYQSSGRAVSMAQILW